MKKTITFIGGGTIARHILSGLHKSRTKEFSHIWVVDTDAKARKRQTKRNSQTILEKPDQNILGTDILVLATKPQSFGSVVDSLSEFGNDIQANGKNTCVVSLMAGVSLSTLKRSMPWPVSFVRAMPNLCSASRTGTTVWYSDSLDIVSEENVTQLFRSFGDSIEVCSETELTTATALSGAGPAYVSRMISALIDAGVYQGLDRELSTNIVKSMVDGTARHLKLSDEHPKIFSEKVVSPGGVTSRALAVLDDTKFNCCLQNAVSAASSHQPYVTSPNRAISRSRDLKEPQLEHAKDFYKRVIVSNEHV